MENGPRYFPDWWKPTFKVGPKIEEDQYLAQFFIFKNSQADGFGNLLVYDSALQRLELLEKAIRNFIKQYASIKLIIIIVS
jgi:hypothetical protein